MDKRSRTSRLRARNGKRLSRIALGVVAGCLLLVIGVLIGRYTFGDKQREEVVSSKVSEKKISSSQRAGSASRQSLSETSSSSSSQDVDPWSLVQFNGEYRGSNGNVVLLNFPNGKVLMGEGQKQSKGLMKSVIKHDDGSLVIHFTGLRETGERYYMAYLLVPAGQKLEKNWQVGKALTDQTDETRTRISSGISHDGGKNYDLSLAYDTFSKNSRERSQYGRVLLYQE